jgi:hypothetical protein
MGRRAVARSVQADDAVVPELTGLPDDVIEMLRHSVGLPTSPRAVAVSAEPSGDKPLSQMDDQQHGEHVGCKGRIKDELRKYLALHIATHDELSDKLERHEQNDPEQVKPCKDCIAQGCAAISEYNDRVTSDGVTYAKMFNRAKTRDRGHNAKARIQAKGAVCINQTVPQG